MNDEAKLRDAEARQTKAAAVYAHAVDDHAAKKAAYDRATAVYAADPTAANTARVFEDRNALDLSTVRMEAARAPLDVATREKATARQALADAHKIADAAARERRVEELRARASPAGLHEATAALFEVSLHSYDVERETTAKIGQAFAEARKASAELRAMGVPSVDVGGHVLFRSIVERILRAHPEKAAGVLEVLAPQMALFAAPGHAFEPGIGGDPGAAFAARFENPLLEMLSNARGVATSEEQRAAAVDALKLYFSTPSYSAAVVAARARAAVPDPEQPPAPAAPEPLTRRLFRGLASTWS